jgi:phosphoribosyl 1,2-cyclic phosphodiesterase
MRFCVLGSGSSGNCVVIESGDERILVDAGFSCREIERRLDVVGISSRRFAAVCLTHEHGDHTRGAPRFSRRHGVPIHATRGTLSAVRLLGHSPPPVVIESGRSFEVGSFSIEPFAVPHDAREPVGLVVESEGCRLGLAADLGRRSAEAWRRLRHLDGLVLETNHDVEMLQQGPYPWPLKKRIAGDKGHLSNRDAADGLREILSRRLQWVVLYHLSGTNNLPALAREAVARVLSLGIARTEICVSEQSRPTPWLNMLRMNA